MATKHPQWADLILLGALYVGEFAFVLVMLSLHKEEDRALTTWIFSSTSGLLFVTALVLLLAALVWITGQYLRTRQSGSRWFAFMVAMNVITVVLVLIPIEIALRLLSRESADAPVFIETVLLPRSWERAATYNLKVVEQASHDLSYLVYDDTLGWTVGANRKGGNGLYLSSSEGLRAASQGVVLAVSKDRPRVALVGDSFAFAEGVKFEDSWGHLLESQSEQPIQVLNFGVGGYGVDQAYLRFEKDVLDWKPDVVILGFSIHDLVRSITVYPFINWPEWSIPFSKPRLVVDNGVLQALNVPTMPPHAMFAIRSITELPFLEYDLGYDKTDWEWSVADVLYSWRWLQSRFPRWPLDRMYMSEEEMLRLNSAILRAFTRLATEHGIIPLIAFLPGRADIAGRTRGEETEAQLTLKRLGVPILGTGSCLVEVGYEAAFLPEDPHYSPRGNAAVAKCIGPALRRVLKEGHGATLETVALETLAR